MYWLRKKAKWIFGALPILIFWFHDELIEAWGEFNLCQDEFGQLGYCLQNAAEILFR